MNYGIMAGRLKSVLLFVRNTASSSKFYVEGLSLPLTYCDEEIAELGSGEVFLTLKSVPR